MHRKLLEKPNMSTTFPGLVHDAEVLLLFFCERARVCVSVCECVAAVVAGGGGSFPCL